MKLQGARALITGANQGLGLVVAKAFAAEGARVLLCARDGEKLRVAAAEVAALAPAKDAVRSRVADVSKADDCQALADEARSAWGGLDVVVANARIYGPLGPFETNDLGQWVEALNVNLLGVVHTCRAVVPGMKAARKGRIIVLGGGGATKGMPNFSAYAASKAGAVRFAETIALELEPSGIAVNVVAPGALNTRLLDEVLAAGADKVGADFHARSKKQQASGGDSPERAAALCVFLASPASDGITGKLISARWDPWEELPARLDDLRRTDVYTLRRIVPAERGMTWGGS
jgi:NAD(P)-dependent dehydrogenase (short-subunit alcohol dehydrogenase family)